MSGSTRCCNGEPWLPVLRLAAGRREKNPIHYDIQIFCCCTASQVLTRYADLWGEIMMWPFGAVLEVKEHPDAKDHIFDSSYVLLR